MNWKYSLALCCLVVALPLRAVAQSQIINIYNQPAAGSDMWTSAVSATFKPHTNTCTGTDVFVAIAGGTTGYCIEVNERSAQEWEGARDTCVGLGKRLPEIGEFQYACNQAGSLSLSNMTNNEEWGSNFALPFFASWGNYGTSAPLVGNGGCNYAGTGVVGDIYTSSISRAFRCVS